VFRSYGTRTRSHPPTPPSLFRILYTNTVAQRLAAATTLQNAFSINTSVDGVLGPEPLAAAGQLRTSKVDSLVTSGGSGVAVCAIDTATTRSELPLRVEALVCVLAGDLASGESSGARTTLSAGGAGLDFTATGEARRLGWEGVHIGLIVSSVSSICTHKDSSGTAASTGDTVNQILVGAGALPLIRVGL